RGAAEYRGRAPPTTASPPKSRSKVGLEEPAEVLREARLETPAAPALERDGAASLEVVLEGLLQPFGEVPVVEGEAVLGVLSHGARVEIDRPDHREHPVHDHRLVVHHSGLVLEDLDAPLQQLSVVLLRSPPQQRDVDV